MVCVSGGDIDFDSVRHLDQGTKVCIEKDGRAFPKKLHRLATLPWTVIRNTETELLLYCDATGHSLKLDYGKIFSENPAVFDDNGHRVIVQFIAQYLHEGDCPSTTFTLDKCRRGLRDPDVYCDIYSIVRNYIKKLDTISYRLRSLNRLSMQSGVDTAVFASILASEAVRREDLARLMESLVWIPKIESLGAEEIVEVTGG